MTGLFDATLTDTAARIRDGSLGARDLAEGLLARIARHDGRLHAYATVTAELALETAAAIDRARARGRPLGMLAGVPIGLKDIIAAAGAPTHLGSRALRNWRPGADAKLAARLRAAGAVLIGKHQTTEGACGGHHPSIAPPVNPWHASAWTGVSSSGSGVAVAAALAFGAFGTDTGGSIRFPAHCCGLVGLKPTHAAIPAAGVFPLAPRFDTVGPLARTVADVALLATAAGLRLGDGPDGGWQPPRRRLALTVGWDEAYCAEGLDAALAAGLAEVAAALRGAGATLVPVNMPRLGDVADAWLALTARAAAAAHAATYPARATEYGPALAALLDYGRGLTPTAVRAAGASVAAHTRRLNALFDDIDLLVSPVLHGPTPRDDAVTRALRADGVRRLVAFTAPANLAACPSLSLPGGLDAYGVPWGYQLIGRRHAERLLCDAGHALEQARAWPQVAPDWTDAASGG